MIKKQNNLRYGIPKPSPRGQEERAPDFKVFLSSGSRVRPAKSLLQASANYCESIVTYSILSTVHGDLPGRDI